MQATERLLDAGAGARGQRCPKRRGRPVRPRRRERFESPPPLRASEIFADMMERAALAAARRRALRLLLRRSPAPPPTPTTTPPSTSTPTACDCNSTSMSSTFNGVLCSLDPSLRAHHTQGRPAPNSRGLPALHSHGLPPPAPPPDSINFCQLYREACQCRLLTDKQHNGNSEGDRDVGGGAGGCTRAGGAARARAHLMLELDYRPPPAPPYVSTPNTPIPKLF